MAAPPDSAMPANLGGGLRQLGAWHAAEAAAMPAERRKAAVQEHLAAKSTRIQSDAAGRVIVDVYLNGAATEEEVRAALTALGAEAFASLPAGQTPAAAHGVISAYLPVGQAATAARLPGVRSIVLVHRPWQHVGAKTSQGIPPLKVNPVLRRHINGTGIVVGVVSDSYDQTTPHAASNVLRDDLPGERNPAKHTTPVVVLEDADPADRPVDEGRAMLQIIHDVAPGGALAFCTSGHTQTTFADAIRRLRTDANCDVIVDDIGFPDEPVFSDGIVAQAVEDVANSTTLAGKKVLYYSAAGNSGSLGYEADFSKVTDFDARNGQGGSNNLKLFQVPTPLTSGGFHNFTPGAGSPTIVQKFIASGFDAEIDFQWNDLFDPASITSNFNVLVFDADGNYLPDVSGTDDNFSTGQALELLDLDTNPDGSDRTYQIAITRVAAGSGAGQHFRYFTNTNGDIGGTYLAFSVPSTLGHEASRSGDGIGAYGYFHLARPEFYTSFGPASIYFDDQGHRLSTPEVRNQPTMSGPDGVSTTVRGFNFFFGTSAAAPHVAGVAALILQATGGPGSMTAAQVRQALQSTTRPHDLDPLSATAESSTDAGTVTLTGYGDVSNFSSGTDRFFTLHFEGPAGSQLQSVLIDLTPARLKFDQSSALGFPFTVNEATGGASPSVAIKMLPGATKLRMTFTAFPPGGTLRFGIDRDVASLKRGGNLGDQLARATVTASILPAGASVAVKQTGTFVNEIGAGYSPADGFGFINADAALKSLGH